MLLSNRCILKRFLIAYLAVGVLSEASAQLTININPPSLGSTTLTVTGNGSETSNGNGSAFTAVSAYTPNWIGPIVSDIGSYVRRTSDSPNHKVYTLSSNTL
jgi:hypothetical protein